MEIKVGEVEDYFSKVGVVAFTLAESLKVGDTIHIKGHTTDITQVVESIQIDRKPVQQAQSKDSVGIKVKDRARKGDTIYRVEP
ncbi:MAG: translation elongation factor-like protein [Elusimicrobia bacterium]|nr:translation elongation factor-like protein [Elusimicrobiota bacterium]